MERNPDQMTEKVLLSLEFVQITLNGNSNIDRPPGLMVALEYICQNEVT